MSPVPPSRPARRRRRWPIVLGAVVVLAIAGGVVGWYTTRSSGSGPTDDWAEAVTSSARYSVDLPGEFRRLQDDTPIAGTTFPIEVLAVGDGGLDRLEPGALFVEVDLSAQPLVAQASSQPELAHTVLQAQARATFEAAGVTFSDVQNVDSPLGPAIRQSGTVPGRDLVVRGFAGLNDGWVVAAITIFPTADAADADRTLDRIVASITPA